MRTRTIAAVGVGLLALSAAVAVGGPNGHPAVDDSPAAIAASPVDPWPHMYALSTPDGAVEYRQLAPCNAGCFTLEDPQAPGVTTAYTWRPEATQWQTERQFNPQGITCPDGHTESSWMIWASDDLTHFFSDTEAAPYCGADQPIQPDSLKFTITPAL